MEIIFNGESAGSSEVEVDENGNVESVYLLNGDVESLLLEAKWQKVGNPYPFVKAKPKASLWSSVLH